MSAAPGDVKRIGAGELRAFIQDAGELKKGTLLYDGGQLLNLARYENKLFCDAKGSGASPYKVSLVYSDAPAPAFKGRCSCPARTFNTAFCKHAAALLVAWARAPESFAVSEAAPPGAPGGDTARKSVKKGSANAQAMMKSGVEQVGTLVRELGVSGVATIGGDRIEQMEKLAEALRENRLRRLSARTLDLAALLRRQAAGGRQAKGAPRGALPAVAYANVMADLLLTARKLEKHLAGEPLDDRHVEELVGKTWKASDRKPAGDLTLVEYAFSTRTTSDDFVIRESRFIDLESGRHFSEKQILPVFLAKRTEPKRSFAGEVLAGARATTYPGYPPLRVDFSDLGDKRPLDAGALESVLARALPDVGAALAALQEHRKDVFAPDLVPVAVLTDTLFARGARLSAVDDKGEALHLPDDPALEERLAGSLRDARLRALLGDVGIDAALPTLWPLAAVVEGPLGLELRAVFDQGAEQGSAARGGPLEGSAWNAAAREAGASPAAIALGEVREELAEALVTGLTGLSARATDPLAARLRDLRLEKQAALLQALPQRTEPADRLDDFIKLYQVLEMALVRLAGATQIDRASTERVPTYESVAVARPDEALSPDEVARRRAAGAMNRYVAAVHHARYYAALPASELVANIFPIWADGTATPTIARTFAPLGAEAIAAAEKALTVKAGRVAKLTAVRVLQAVVLHGGPARAEATAMLRKVEEHAKDAGLRALARDALDVIDVAHVTHATQPAGPGGDWVRARRAARLGRVHELAKTLGAAPTKEERLEALKALSELGDLAALPALRRAFYGDVARGVREEAAYALAQLGDVEMVETFVRMLASRSENEQEAKIAAYALGFLGDVRGLSELLSAYADGYKPGIVADAIRAFGPVALTPLVDLIEARPELAKRAAALDALKKMDDAAVAACLVERIEARRGDADLADKAQLYLKLADVHAHSRREVATALIAALSSAPGKEAQAAVKAAQKALGVVKRSK
ncbi:HEAT repeat domain-containing protein [Sorangium atrum]|uniref:HEAT repeat domain-containing protein n=1 Tax=Sorangium atrum TaxID=2995308 RepID=A0ABT5CE68_9BACT|nr:HEAT repeat domain-containing protein [Sorangium aterium]MDC0684115.1 HEAT repeat domain-containing protein [Sorangium aterium]